jgi:hypothetical protein
LVAAGLKLHPSPSSEAENFMKGRGIALISLAGIGGLYFLFIAAQYIFTYFAEPDNSLRHEYLQGAAIASGLSVPFWLMVSVCTYFYRKALPKPWFVVLNVPSFLLLVGFLLVMIIPVLLYVLENGH